MSRAFVKEAEDKVEDFPDRAISRHRNLVTSEGFAQIEEALARFERAHLEASSSNDAHAAAAAMREIRYWRARRASAEVVPPRPPAGVDTASFGTTVTLRRDDGRKQTFRIVGEDEADPSQGTVSYVSPLARAVMTYGPGDTVEIAGGKAEILDVR
jgi:transcription elongation GreA/GreB family factor